MALVNRLWNNSFVNPLQLPLLCEISGAIHLVQPDLTAGSRWQACLYSKYTKFYRRLHSIYGFFTGAC